VVETRRGVGTFCYGAAERSASRRDRDRHLRELADHFITETHTRGFFD